MMSESMMMCPVPFMVNVEDSWKDENEICTVYAIRDYRGVLLMISVVKVGHFIIVH